MTAKQRGALEGLGLLGLLVASALVERHASGIELIFVAFAAILAGLLFRSALVALGRLEPAPPAALALGLASASGLLAYPIGAWGHGLAGLAAFLATRPPRSGTDTSPEASRLERGLAIAGLLVAGGAAWLVALQSGSLTLPFATALVLAVEALGPGAPWTVAHVARRARSAAIVAAAGVAHLQYQESGLRAEDVILGVVALVGIEATLLVVRRPAADPARSPLAPLRPWLVRAFVAAVVANALLLTVARVVAPERRLDLRTLAPRHLRGQDTLATLPHFTALPLPDDAVVLEDGKPLPFPHAQHDAVAALGSGRYAIWDGRVVHFSSTDGTDPLANGRRYEVAYVPELERSAPAETFVLLTCLLGLLAWSAGGLDVTHVSPLALRLALVATIVLALAAGLPRGWNRIFTSADTDSYVLHSDIRPMLYPAFLDAFDATPGVTRHHTEADKSGFPHEEPGGRFLGAVRAQKVLTVVAVGVLAWTFSGTLNAWLVALLAYVGVLADVSAVEDFSATKFVSGLLSEGLNFPLTLLWIAAVFAYLRRPRWLWGVAIALLTTALFLVRPANGSLVGVFALIALFHLVEDGWKKALVRSGTLAVLFAIPVLLACWQNQQKTGYFRLHAFTGMNVFCTGFQVATPDEAEAFSDPELREFMRICTVDYAAKRVNYWENPNGDYVNVNLYEIGLPAIKKVIHLPPEKAGLYDYAIDGRMAVVGKKIIARHPWAFAKLVLFHLDRITSLRVHGPVLLAILLAAELYRRKRSWLVLFFVFFALLPMVSMVPSCVFNFPLGRYRSQLLFAEVLTIPLLVAVLATLLAPARGGASASSAPDKAA